jgi:hypothetical protein
MVTEDNAEAYMSMIQGFLTLDAFKTSLAQRTTAAMAPSARMTPAYPMVRVYTMTVAGSFLYRCCAVLWGAESCA